MRTIKRYMALAVVLAIIDVGGLTLALTPEYHHDHALETWGGLGLSALFFALGLWLGHTLDKKNLLPE